RREAAEAEVALQKRRVEKLEKLRREGHSTQEETERAQADYAIAVSQLRAVNEELGRKQLEVAQIQAQIDRRHIAAPMDGIVTELLKEPGESVSANESHVATVVQLELLRVKFYISTQDAQQLRQGSSVNLLLIETGQEVEGTTEYICPITDAESGTVRVEFVLENARGDYRSGLRCKWQPMTTGQP
ncbi:MAG: efflux RND transporter periplasmic adaptor subunit, partial [Planctomycetales bacterium]|nr:efflux RND transporter periplasmic adaptor subunit [Planctomycetales bacterium]